MDTLQKFHFVTENAVFKKLESLNLADLSRKERRKYDSAIKAYRDYHNQMDFAMEEGIAIGKQRGIAIGMQRGIAIGKQRGIAIGKQRAKKEAIIPIARKIKNLGAPIDMIQKATGLSLEEIQDL